MSSFKLQNIERVNFTGTGTGVSMTHTSGGVSVGGFINATEGVSAGTMRINDNTITTNSTPLTVIHGLATPTDIANFRITDTTITNTTTNSIDFDSDNVITTGTLGCGVLTAASGSGIGNLTLANGSITDSSGAISFGDEILTGTGTVDFSGGVSLRGGVSINGYTYPTSLGTSQFLYYKNATTGVSGYGLVQGSNITLTYGDTGVTIASSGGGGGGGGATNIDGLADAFADNTNVVLGVSPQSISGSNNVGVGVSALNAITGGNRNIALGFDALIAGTTASDSIAIGYSSLRTISTGTQAQNVAIGTSTLSVMTGAGGAGQNVAVGYIAGQNVTGSENTIVGASAGITLTSGGNNSLIGFGAEPTSAGVSHEFTLGNSSIVTLRCADTTIASLSDSRDKTDVEDSRFGIGFLNNVRPVEFTWQRRNLAPGDENNNKNGLRRVGFLAQELLEAMPDGENDILDLVYESNPDRLEAKYGNLIPVLVKAVKDLKAEVDALKQRMDNCSC